MNNLGTWSQRTAVLATMFALMFSGAMAQKLTKPKLGDTSTTKIGKQERKHEGEVCNEMDGQWLPQNAAVEAISNNSVRVTLPSGFRTLPFDDAAGPMHMAQANSATITCSCAGGNCSPLRRKGKLYCVVSDGCTTCTRSTSALIVQTDGDVGYYRPASGAEPPSAVLGDMLRVKEVRERIESFIKTEGMQDAPPFQIDGEQAVAPGGYVFVPINLYGYSAYMLAAQSTVKTRGLAGYGAVSCSCKSGSSGCEKSGVGPIVGCDAGQCTQCQMAGAFQTKGGRGLYSSAADSPVLPDVDLGDAQLSVRTTPRLGAESERADAPDRAGGDDTSDEGEPASGGINIEAIKVGPVPIEGANGRRYKPPVLVEEENPLPPQSDHDGSHREGRLRRLAVKLSHIKVKDDRETDLPWQKQAGELRFLLAAQISQSSSGLLLPPFGPQGSGDWEDECYLPPGAARNDNPIVINNFPGGTYLLNIHDCYIRAYSGETIDLHDKTVTMDLLEGQDFQVLAQGVEWDGTKCQEVNQTGGVLNNPAPDADGNQMGTPVGERCEPITTQSMGSTGTVYRVPDNYGVGSHVASTKYFELHYTIEELDAGVKQTPAQRLSGTFAPSRSPR